MDNTYHIIHFKPGIERWEMSFGYEDLAQRLVRSGRFRIDAGENKLNFARLYIPSLDISMTFSYKEIYDSILIKRTKKAIASHLSNFITGKTLERKVNFYFNTLKDEIKKHAQPTSEEEIKLARLVVQAAHPVVIELLMLDHVEVFLSYSHTIGDVLDIQTWQTSGSNSGMQSLKGQEKTIFISCGGNPLRANKEPDAEYGDGKPAIARILIIGAQEIAHYSDIRRDAETGRPIFDRHSSDIYVNYAKPKVKIGRINDINRANSILKQLTNIGLPSLLEIEKAIKFYRKVNRRGLIFFTELLKLYIKKIIFKHKAKKLGLYKIIKQLDAEQYQASMLKRIIIDMKFNLAPKADVYANKNKDIEEAIACAEALARVPQQKNKWGRYLTKIFMHNLYRIYYTNVIPECIHAYNILCKKDFAFNNKKIGRSIFEVMKSSLRDVIEKLFKMFKNTNN
ncbi:MAG: DUF2748 family protein [Rickettsiales bacterium]|nr:DUF2748 family protein [Rickettsiales bacterium]